MVVGMSDYEDGVELPRLNAPVQDARMMSDRLETAGFASSLATDLTQAGFDEALAGFKSQLRRAVLAKEEDVESDKSARDDDDEVIDVALFYFSGHGRLVLRERESRPVEGVAAKNEADARQLYEQLRLYPIDAHSADAGFSIDQVVDSISGTGVDVLIVIIDTCRTGGSGIGFDTTFRYEHHGVSMFFMFSTSPGGTSLQGTSGSLFTDALGAHMLEPGVRIEGVAMLTSNDVYEGSGATMNPWQYSSLKQPFYFVPEAERVTFWLGGVPVPVMVSGPLPPPMRPPLPGSEYEEDDLERSNETPRNPSDEGGGGERGGSEGNDDERGDKKRGRVRRGEGDGGDDEGGDSSLVATKEREDGKRRSDLTRRQKAIVGLTVSGAWAFAAGGATLPFWWTIRNGATRLVDTTPGYEEGTAVRASYLASEEQRARRYLIGSSVTMGVGAVMIATGTGLSFGKDGGDRGSRRFPLLGRGLGILLASSGGAALVGGVAVMAGWWTVRSDAEKRADQKLGYEEGTEARRAFLAAEEERARSYLYLGSAIVGGAAVTMVAGWVLMARAGRQRSERRGASRVVPVVGREYGGLSVEGRF